MIKCEYIKLLKIRGVITLRKGESLNAAMKRTGGFHLTKKEKILMKLMKD